jgi:tRNA pseudouridine55 synthase
MSDILLVDKPAGWTSFDVVAKIRGQIRAEYTARGEKPTKRQLKVGHAGTLDPFATGLLIILLGDATKRADEFLKLDKTYEFTARLGEVSTTGDPEGEIAAYRRQTTVDGEQPSPERVREVLKEFTGEISQVPPVYSAIKVDGKRAYAMARKGQEVKLEPRNVTIYSLELVSYAWPELRCTVKVSSGTYIRSLVADIGEALGTGAYCTQLRRTEIGNYTLTAAHPIDSLPKPLTK